ncbi:MAG: amidohydrolase family protein [Acidimicrobiales bacterium]|nr:amidohydrolase family protein [Acidimicrobiales bacterium]
MIFDADNHYYEPADCFTRFMPSDQMDEAIRVVDDGGRPHVMVGDRPFTFLGEPFSAIHTKPGSLREMLRNMKAGLPIEENDAIESVQPAYQDRSARLALMDEQGVDAMVLFPTVAVCVEHFMKENPQRTFLNVHAFNQWLEEDWGFGADGRIYGVPLLSLIDLDAAIAELEFVLDRGARFIHLRPGPQGGRNPADPVFDPFWARVDEAGVTVTFHISESGYNELFSVAWGEEANPSSHQQSAFQWTSFYGDLPIMQTISGMTFMNFFGRFPNVRVMSVENGSLWVPYLLAAMDKMKGMGRNGPWPGGYVSGRPSEVVKEKVFVSPYHEENIPALCDVIGASQVLFGSDFPHAEGLAEPLSFRDGLTGLATADQDLIMGQTMASLAAGPA